MSDKKLAIRGVVFNWLGRASSLVIAFVVTPIIVTNLGNGNYGVWSLLMAFASYYGLMDLGLLGTGGATTRRTRRA